MIDFWVKKGILYESGTYHNLVFVGKDTEGIPRFASQRGTLDKYGKPFKGDVTGNDKTYGVNLVDQNSDTLYVYEAAIDAMSDMELRGDYRNNILVLGMLSDGPLEKFLKDYPHIRKIQFCLDNDLPGRQAAKKLARKYTLMEYEVFVRLPPMGKDYNAFLQYKKENQELSSLVEKERPLFTETKGKNVFYQYHGNHTCRRRPFWNNVPAEGYTHTRSFGISKPRLPSCLPGKNPDRGFRHRSC